jgi:hypothetical protein
MSEEAIKIREVLSNLREAKANISRALRLADDTGISENAFAKIEEALSATEDAEGWVEEEKE